MIKIINKNIPLVSLSLGGLLVCVFHLITMMLGFAPDFSGQNWYINWDTDSYTRLLRIRQLYDSSLWFDSHAPYFNAPYGIEMHWTRALDLLLLPGAWLGTWLGNVDYYLELWSAWLLGPFSHLLYVPLLYWIVGRFTNMGGFLLLILMFISSVIISHSHLLGFIDYHGLLALLLLLLMGLIVRESRANGEENSGFLVLGMVSAFMVWLSVEGLLLIVPLLIVLGIFFVLEHQNYLGRIQSFSVTFFCFLVLFLFLERPLSGWGGIETDRLSLLHVIIAVIMLGGCVALRILSQNGYLNSKIQRLVWSGLMVFVCLAGLIYFFPAIWGHPQQEIGDIVAFLLDGQPGERAYFAINRPLSIILLEVGPSLITLPYMVYVLVTAKEDKQRRFLIYTVFVIFFMGYLLFKQRAIIFYQIVILLPWFETVWAAWGKIRNKFAAPSFIVQVGGISLLVVLVFFHYIPYGYAQYQQYRDAPISPKVQSCNYEEIIPYITGGNVNKRDFTILAPLFAGPELVYKSGFSVIASPYHRNRQGIEDGFILGWENSDSPGIRALAKSRRLRYVVSCTSYFNNKKDALKQNPRSLYARLLNSEPPFWLHRVKLPDSLQDRYLLYRTR